VKMVKTRQVGQIRSALRWLSLFGWGSIGLGLTLTTGCSSTPMASGPAADPLHGVLVPPGLPQPTNTPKVDAGGIPPAPQAYNQGGVQAFPASMSSSNPATLAGTSWQGPLGRPLAIDDGAGTGPPFLPGQVSRTQPLPGVLGANPNPKVERVPDITPPAQPVTPTASWQTNPAPIQPTAGVQPASDDALAKQLQDAGVINQKQDTVAEGLRLTCYVSRGPGEGLRIIEVTAADYAAAAQAILQQLNASR
jgi:hypothetical protein